MRAHRYEKGIKSRKASPTHTKISRRSNIPRYGVRQTAEKKPARANPDILLTIAQAAKILNVHVNTIRRWSNKGVLKTYRLGSRGDRRLKQGDINKLLRKGKPAKMSG